MEMDWTHSAKTNFKHHKTSADLESPRQTEERLPRNTWRWELEADTRQMECMWQELEKKAQQRDVRRDLVDGQCPPGGVVGKKVRSFSLMPHISLYHKLPKTV